LLQLLRAFVAVKAFLAQAKDEFNKKWDEPAQVDINVVYCFLRKRFLSLTPIFHSALLRGKFLYVQNLAACWFGQKLRRPTSS